MIKVNDPFPDATLYESVEFTDACPLAPQTVSTTEACREKRIVIFGLPGAFTPTCSAEHVPGYLEHLPALKRKGVDEVWCVSVNDGYVMAAWGKEQGAIGKIRMLGDGEAELTRKLGLDVHRPGMGIRMQRCSLLVENGIVTKVNVEKPREFEVSRAEAMLTQLG